MRRTVAAAAILVAVATVMSLVPLPAEGDSGTAPSVSIVENGDGVYELRSDYFEDAFGLYPDPSDIEDPVNGMMDVVPMELATPYGSQGLRLYEPDDVGTSHSVNGPGTYGDKEGGVTFAADLSGLSRDWTCTLYISGGHMRLSAVSNIPGDSSSYDVDVSAGYGYFYSEMHAMGVANVLVHEVGDYDGDGDEDIAVYYNGHIGIFGLLDDGLGLWASYDLTISNSDPVRLPVSMCAIDLDGDRADDLVVSLEEIDREFFRHTRICVIVPTYDGAVEKNADWLDSITVHEEDGDEIDTTMVSLEAADVDGDGTEEVVVGGYAWDSSRTDTGHTQDWRYHAGELFLGYYEADEIHWSWDTNSVVNDMLGFTVLGDDDGSAANLFYGSDHYRLSGGHNIQDTSIYTEVDDSSELSRSPTWYNWTIPMAGVDLEGYNDGLREQVFFNTYFYELNGDRFDVHSMITPYSSTADFNRMMCTGIEAAVIWSQDPSEWNGRESLFISYTADLVSQHYSGDTEMSFVIFDYTGGEYADKTEGEYWISADVRLHYGWDSTHVPPNAFLINTDDDFYLAEYMAHLYTYTDPSVIAVVSGVPYDEDLADVLISGADSIGSTEFERSSESGTGTESSFEISFGPQAGLEIRLFEGSLGAGYSYELSNSKTQTVSFSTSYESAEDAVAMYVVPMDVYFYNVYESDGNGGLSVSVQPVVWYQDAVNVMMEYEKYVEFIENYNAMMGAMSDDYTRIPVVDIGVHEQGDISSFKDHPSDPLGSVTVTYRGDGIRTTVTQCVDLSEESEHSDGHGGFFNLDCQFSFLKAMAGFTVEGGGMDADFTVNTSGMAFTSALNQGMEIDYLGDPSEAGEVLGQYVMNGDFWAEMRSSYDAAGNQLDYVYVGYTVDSYSTAPEPASLAPDVYIPDGTDEDDPYNPTADSVYLRADLPAVPDSRPERLADEYVLQISWQGRWYDAGSTTLGIASEVQTADGWAAGDSVSTGGDGGQVWFRVSGLSGLGYQSYDFRIVAETVTGVQERTNPSLPVTAYLDLRQVADRLVVVESVSAADGTVTIDGRHLTGDGSLAVVVKTGLRGIGPVLIQALMEDGRMETLAERIYLNSDGSAVILLGDDADDGTSDDGGSSLPFLVGGIVLAMVVAGLVVRRE